MTSRPALHAKVRCRCRVRRGQGCLSGWRPKDPRTSYRQVSSRLPRRRHWIGEAEHGRSSGRRHRSVLRARWSHPARIPTNHQLPPSCSSQCLPRRSARVHDQCRARRRPFDSGPKRPQSALSSTHRPRLPNRPKRRRPTMVVLLSSDGRLCSFGDKLVAVVAGPNIHLDQTHDRARLIDSNSGALLGPDRRRLADRGPRRNHMCGERVVIVRTNKGVREAHAAACTRAGRLHWSQRSVHWLALDGYQLWPPHESVGT
jgi:hypothetical protein